jgi:hypothetical protein
LNRAIRIGAPAAGAISTQRLSRLE